MDFLLIVLSIGGVVFAAVMLVLASRARRMERESDTRVERLQALATGSVLFTPDAPVELGDDLLELRDETAVLAAPEPAPRVSFDTAGDAYPFVLTVPAGAGRVAGSFARTQRRSRT